ncbi:MAG TPA: nitrous oxide reductase accessory protein NosL [Burkholderiales bacterium]|nr:nitrous oxide reductase accessory protein NosL [Burkholderiales bacterium]
MIRKATTLAVLALTLAVGAAGCGEAERAKTAQPVEITRSTACSLDGMVLADYPGPKAQMHYTQGQPDFFCDTVEMFSVFLRPEQQKRVTAVYVQDMGKTDWDHPQGNWIDARTAVYVHGSKRRGSMGPTVASFAREEDARAFAERHGGKLLRFAEVKPEMVILDGGALHDQRM